MGKNLLTQSQIRNWKPRSQPRSNPPSQQDVLNSQMSITDGKGLTLFYDKKNDRKTWKFRKKGGIFGSTGIKITIGDVSLPLSTVRKKRDEYLDMIARGIDPIEDKIQCKIELENKLFQKQNTFDKVSGGSVVNRPELKRMMDFARRGDTVIAHQIDRLARSLQDLLWIVETLVKKGVSVKFHKENLVFKAGKDDAVSILMLQLLGSVSQFEKSLINSRVLEGVLKAKLLGKYKGRQRSVSEETVQKILSLRDRGYRKTDICKELGLSRSTVYRYLYDPVNWGCKGSFTQ